MTDPVIALGQVLSRDMQRITLHAGNIANANNTGFQARVYHDESGAAPTSQTKASSQQTVNINSQGKLRATGRPLDVAIIGQGWLVESSSSGQLLLTRNGKLSVSPEGYLTTGSNAQVLGHNGPVFVGGAAQVVIDMHGNVHADGAAAGTLFIAERPAGASALPDGRYPLATSPATATGATLAAGVLEQSNVDIAREMTGMMLTSRHLESTQRALQLYEQTLATGISQIGKE